MPDFTFHDVANYCATRETNEQIDDGWLLAQIKVIQSEFVVANPGITPPEDKVPQLRRPRLSSAEALVVKSDRALYQVKAAGRDTFLVLATIIWPFRQGFSERCQ